MLPNLTPPPMARYSWRFLLYSYKTKTPTYALCDLKPKVNILSCPDLDVCSIRLEELYYWDCICILLNLTFAFIYLFFVYLNIGYQVP